MGRRALIVLPAGLLVAALAGGGAQGAVIKPRAKPQTNGPLDYGGKACDSVRDGPAVFRYCDHFFDIRNGREGDDDRDYGVIFTKEKVVVDRGVCTSFYLDSINNLSGGEPFYSFHRKAPGRNRIRLRRTKRYTTKLPVKGGNNSRVGVVKTRWSVRKGRLMTKLIKRDSGLQMARQKWRGRSCQRVFGLAFAVEASVPDPVSMGRAVPFRRPWDALRGAHTRDVG